MKKWILIVPALILAGCSQQPQKDWDKADEYQRTRYSQDKDSMPTHGDKGVETADAIPRHEPKTRAGNITPYKVFGKTYHVLPTEKGYKATGEASWYGMKFHGHKTSNGEVYDVNKMSAAHKTLPLPSYVKVTNLENGKSCVVRVNDRGPFKDSRLIDLSYAAAKKLDYINSGTARVKVEAITPKGMAVSAPTYIANNTKPSAFKAKDKVFLQVGAYKDEQIAQKQYQYLAKAIDAPLILKRSIDSYFRLFVGPIAHKKTDAITEALAQAGFPKPLLLQEL